jgi:hypothetical protein
LIERLEAGGAQSDVLDIAHGLTDLEEIAPSHCAIDHDRNAADDILQRLLRRKSGELKATSKIWR